MEKVYESLKKLIEPELVETAATVLGEKKENVSKAINKTMASFLGVYLKKGHSPQVRNIIDEAGNLDILPDRKNICEEKPTKEQQNIGDDFLQHLLGDKAADFTNPIAEETGITKVAQNRLVSITAPIFAGYLGEKIKKDNWTHQQLLDEIDKEKDSFGKEIPAGVVKSFGLAAKLHPEEKTAVTPPKEEPKKKKKSMNWIIILLIILLLLVFLWRYCNRHKEVSVTEVVTTEIIDPVTTTNNNASTEITLPNGVKLQANKGGIEDKLVQYLQSDEYKKAKSADLKKKIFEFDNVDFEFGSTTQLMPNSQTQLNNIAEILKYFKDTKVEIIGYADKKGTEEVNLDVSKERAKTVESLLENKGVGSQIAKTDGYGEEYAEVSASASDEARAKDRDIALRIVK